MMALMPIYTCYYKYIRYMLQLQIQMESKLAFSGYADYTIGPTLETA